MNEEILKNFVEIKSKMYELMSKLGTGHNEIWYNQLLQSINWMDTAIKNLEKK
jgi:hypothetical protein